MKAAVRFDGGSRGNPGPSACGYTVELEGILHEGGDYLGIRTNNQAEYSGLVNALTMLSELKEPSSVDVSIYADSELVVKQVNGQYRVKNANIIPLYQNAVLLLRRFKSFKISHVRREENKVCDAIVNRILDEKARK